MSNSTYYWGGNDLKSGSSGRDVEQWQTFLKNQGYYNGAIDGIFGSVTDAATKAYQKAMGLTEDGIAGIKTMSSAGFKNYNTPVGAPTYKPYDTTSWNDTDEGKAALDAKNAAAGALTGYGSFTWDNQAQYDDLYKKYTERDPFSYDFNADALYHQYKDMYMKQGQMAMQDTMGQAAAMTGGYGNSYAASVGNQAYQQSLQQLNGVIPELYQLALSKYSMEGQDMLNALGLMESDRAYEYGLYNDEYSRLGDVYNIASDNYTTGANMHYTDLGNINAGIDRENDNSWKVADWEETQRLDARDAATKIVTGGSTGGGSANGSGSGSGSGKDKGPTGGGGGFTGKTYESAVSYLESKGVPKAHAAGIMTAGEWSRRRQSYQTYGTGGASVKNYSSYAEYLAGITEYLVEQYT